MVYESDFYTTRRPYSRPLASSYSITTTPVVLPLSAVIQLRGYLPRMPYIAHKRLVTVIHSPVHNVYYSGSMIPIRIHSRVRPSVIAAELKRIRDLPRPSTESYTEHYLNSKDHIYFDDEAKEIRARVDSLLRRVHVYIPRACPSDFAEEIVPERMRSGDYIRRLISGKNNTKKDAEAVSWYDVPERGHFGNLACVKYVAGKPQSIRRPYYKVADLRPSDIKNDVKFLSYYQKNRQAAADALKQNRQDAAKRAEEYLLKVAEESRTEEEKKQAVEIQLTKYEMEEEKAWEALQIDLDRKAHLDEILEVERAAAERKIEEEKLEKERTEIIRLEEAERQINAEKLRALMEEEERMLIEERAEEVRQRQEREERLAEVSLGITDDKKDADYSREDQLFTEITDQEMEEKPYELPPTDEDTKIEEENVVEYEVEDISMDPFVEEPDGQSRPVPSGGTAIVEENFEWPDEEA